MSGLFLDFIISVYVENISTKRGGKKLCLDRYMYTVAVVAKSIDEVLWLCVKH